MSPESPKKVKMDDKPPISALQAFMGSPYVEGFVVLVIITNVVLMALEPPLPTDPVPHWLSVTNQIFNVIYVLETVLLLSALGAPLYFSDSWRVLDFIVSFSSLVELTFLVVEVMSTIYQFQNPAKGGGGVGFLKILRFFRILRPIKLITFIPSLVVFITAVFDSTKDLLLNGITLMTVLFALSVISWALIGDTLEKRCVPLMNETYYLDDIYYQEFGMDYYYSKYNLNFCGVKPCEIGFICKTALEPFTGVNASYLSPWTAFISNLSFLTLRGWPNIFIAIEDSVGLGTAIFVFFSLAIICSLLFVNLFPAIFIFSLKFGEEMQKKKEVLMQYPGNIESLTELELMNWASLNADDLALGLFKSKPFSLIDWVKNLLLSFFKKNKPKSNDNANKKGKKQVESKTSVVEPVSAPSSTSASHPLLGDESDEDQQNVLHQQTTLCVPNCGLFPKIRESLFGETSSFSRFIIVVVVLNIISMGFEDHRHNAQNHMIQFISNLIFTWIFAIECALKMIFMGPFLFFSSIYNFLDLLIVALGIASLYDPNIPTFILSFRLIKLIRLARIYKMSTLAANDLERLSKDMYITFARVIELFNELFMPLNNVMFLMFLFIYIFAIVGVQFFAQPGPFNYNSYTDLNMTQKLLDSTLVDSASITDLSRMWSGAIVNRMNFNSFINSFVTVTNVMVYNSWYDVMIHYFRGTQSSYSVWFFFVWILLSNYFLFSTITATVVTLMEDYAKAALEAVAKDNKILTKRIARIRKRMLIRSYFMTFKANTLDSDDAKKGGKKDGPAQKRPPIEDVVEKVDTKSFIQHEMENRVDHSLWLFSPDGYIRSWADKFLNGFLFQSCVGAAILISILQAMGILVISSPNTQSLLNLVLFSTFMGEMGLQWIVNCLYGNENAYLNCISTLIDGGVNILMIINQFLFSHPVFNALKVLRLLKVPRILPYVLNNVSLKILLSAYETAIGSMFIVSTMFLIVIGFFGVICLQLWSGSLNRCSYPLYPAGLDMNANTTIFPNGCHGQALLPVSKANNSQLEIFNLSWTIPGDNFEDIFSTSKCIFRVFMFNNWAHIFYSTIDIVSDHNQPQPSFSPTNIIFFLIVIGVAVVVGVFFVGSIYFHFFIQTIISGRKPNFGDRQVAWAMFEESLYKVTPRQESYPPNKDQYPLAHKFYNISHSNWYQFLNFAYGTIPIIMIIAYHPQTYSHRIFLLVDSGFSICYVAEFAARFFVNGFNMLFTLQGKQEVFVIGFISAEIALCIPAYLAGSTSSFFLVLIHVAAFLRTFRVAVAFPTISKNLLVVSDSIFGILPAVFYLVFIILLYGIIGSLTLGYIDPDFGNQFLNERYGFESLNKACLTLGSIGTGNIYTEILSALKTNQSTLVKLYIEVFFTSFYLSFTLVFRSCAVLTIYKYLSLSGQTLGLATQQILEFKRVWFKLKFKNKIKLDQLILLVESLNFPLGLKNENDRTYVVTERFVRSLICCMPAQVDRMDDFDPKRTRNLFPYDILPKNLKNHGAVQQGNWQAHVWSGQFERFTFFQVLVALHKRYMLGFDLPDSMEFAEMRIVSKERLGLMKLRFGQYLISKTENPSPFKILNLMQRLNPKVYQKELVRCLTNTFNTIQKRANSLGFQNSDGFEITCLERAAQCELNSSRLQYALKRKLNSRGLTTVKTFNDMRDAQAYYINIKSIANRISLLKEKNVEKLWRIETFDRVYAFLGTRVPVSAIAVDLRSNVFIGYQNGVIKIFKNMGVASVITEKSNYRLVQKFDFKLHIRAIFLTFEGTQMFVACGNEVIILHLSSSRRKKSSWSEIGRLREHTQIVSCVVSHGKYLLTGSFDGYIMLWAHTSKNLLNTYYIGSPIYSMTLLNVVDDKLAVDDIVLSDVVVVGTSQGTLQLLPLPLLKNPLPNSESGLWEGPLLPVGDMPISCLSSNFGLLYVGLADGSLCTYCCVRLRGPETVGMRPIQKIQMVQVSKQTVHSGPITSVVATGGYMFSSSHDFSILPWDVPPRPDAVTSHDFIQEHREGKIFHNTPIIAMAKNGYILASGDESGMVILSAPQDLKVSLTGTNKFQKNKVFFSFNEYDFKLCFLNHNGVVPEDEVFLDVWNISSSTIVIRNIFKQSPNFRCEVDVQLNESYGARFITLPRAGGKSKKVIELNPNERAIFRLIFTPTEEKSYRQDVEFLINESQSYHIFLNGTGTKPRIRGTFGSDLLDFGTVNVGRSAVRVLKLENTSLKSIIVNLLEEKIEDPSSDKEPKEKYSLSDRNISVLPRCFNIRPGETLKILINFSPEIAMQTFELPLKFVYAGAVYSISKVRARSEHPRLENDDTSELHSTVISQNNHILSMPRGLRKLSHTEMLCPGELVNTMLDNNNWSIQTNPLAGSSCLFQSKSGLFLEIINKSKPSDFPNVENVNIALTCHERSFFELWNVDDLVDFGFCESTSNIEVSINKLFQRNPIDSPFVVMGYQNLELYVWSLGEQPRQTATRRNPKSVHQLTPKKEANKFGFLKSVTRIILQLGYRLYREDTKALQIVERLNVYGIERVLTFEHTPDDGDGFILLSEVFGQTHTTSGDPVVGTAIYSPVKIYTKNSTKTHYHITDKSLAKRDFKDIFKNLEGAETIELGRGLLIGQFDEHQIRRKIDVSLDCRPELKMHSRHNKPISCFAHTTPGLISRGGKAKIDPLKLLPHYIKSGPHSVEISSLVNGKKMVPSAEASVIDPFSYDAAVFDLILMMDKLTCNEQTRTTNIASLHLDSWFFILDKNHLKLVSAEPDATVFVGLVDDLTSADILFDCNGIRILDETKSLIVCEGVNSRHFGKEEESERLQFLDKSNTPFYRCANHTGEGFVLRDSPKFLTDAWAIISNDLRVQSFKMGMKKHTQDRFNFLRKQASLEAQAVLDKQQSFEEAILSKRKNKQLTSAEMLKRKEAERQALDILDRVPNLVTCQLIYDELIRVSIEKWTGKRETRRGLSINLLSSFLEHNVLKGFDKPLKAAEVDHLLLKCARQDGMIQFQYFESWFMQNEADTKMDEFDEKQVVALLMNEYLSKKVFVPREEDEEEEDDDEDDEEDDAPGKGLLSRGFQSPSSSSSSSVFASLRHRSSRHGHDDIKKQHSSRNHKAPSITFHYSPIPLEVDDSDADSDPDPKEGLLKIASLEGFLPN